MFKELEKIRKLCDDAVKKDQEAYKKQAYQALQKGVSGASGATLTDADIVSKQGAGDPHLNKLLDFFRLIQKHGQDKDIEKTTATFQSVFDYIDKYENEIAEDIKDQFLYVYMVAIRNGYVVSEKYTSKQAELKLLTNQELNNKTRTAFFNKEYATAIDCLKELYKRTKQDEYLHNIGTVYKQAGDPFTAYQYFQEYIERSSNARLKVVILYQMSLIQANWGDHDKALDLAMDALKLSPLVNTGYTQKNKQSIMPWVKALIEHAEYYAGEAKREGELFAFYKKHFHSPEAYFNEHDFAALTAHTEKAFIIKVDGQAYKISHSGKKGVMMSPENPNKTVSRKTVLGVTIDLKYSKEKGVRICEINSIVRSGLKGYDKAYGQPLRETELKPFYAQFNSDEPLPHEIAAGEKPARIWPMTAGQRFNGKNLPAILESCLEDEIAPSDTQNNSSYAHVLNSNYKDYFIDAFYEQHSDLFPASMVVGKDSIKADLSAMLEKHPTAQKFVVKPSHSAVSNGVIIVDRDQLVEKCEDIFIARNPKSKDERFLRDDPHPNFVVQECVHSDPVIAADNKSYDGTMRLVASMVYDHEKDDVSIEYHGAYWKLPAQDLDAKLSGPALQKAILSLPPSKLKKDQQGNRPFSAKVDDDAFQDVCDKITPLLHDYTLQCSNGEDATIEGFSKKLAERLKSPNQAPKQTMRDIAIWSNHDHYFTARARFMHDMRVDQTLPETITKRLSDLADGKLKGAKSKNTSHMRAFAKAVLGRPVPDGQSYVRGNTKRALRKRHWSIGMNAKS